ncbi:Gfo/Idh/MocA family protein [Swaminathania salitolerans]|uniref:Galactose 1-dehydrogenase n=1 Tax=Swaminathania salitolerans TaxID=182838 RepID=A0A511BMA6_9PROT|nr:Gfo/Idh/MocA family oxidoreductase [Swaminathania salitolerans]GBQ15719.1 D-galactose 1-dehydrogenase [Swaminathania salitolerans LMG 21291]GEL01461.1 galactose 1-dehydrogenase [Swaminathania salitolerans]
MIRIAMIGIGQIARQQHLPTIAAHKAFTLVAGVSPVPVVLEVPVFPTVAALRESGIGVDAVAICTPPDIRYALACEALDAGWHVLLEKPPATTRSQGVALLERAEAHDITLFSAWHSVHAPAVAWLKDHLPGLSVRDIAIVWKENAEKWHPGAEWLWAPGAPGVFDAGINALSILCALTPEGVVFRKAELGFCPGRGAPARARLALETSDRALGIIGEFDWLHPAESEIWEIVWSLHDGTTLALSEGGGHLLRNGKPVPIGDRPEYAGVYDRFAALVAQRLSDLDLRALDLVTEALAYGRRYAID